MMFIDAVLMLTNEYGSTAEMLMIQSVILLGSLFCIHIGMKRALSRSKQIDYIMMKESYMLDICDPSDHDNIVAASSACRRVFTVSNIWFSAVASMGVVITSVSLPILLIGILSL